MNNLNFKQNIGKNRSNAKRQKCVKNMADSYVAVSPYCSEFAGHLQQWPSI